jgi:DNA-binding winged helix-turn-helix (wHTH) protein
MGMVIQGAHASAKPEPIYASRQWEIDLGQHELRAHGVPVPIGNRTFEIISVLVQSAGKIVSKDDLMGRVWGAIVEENTIQVHISAIRKALGPDRGMLKTISGQFAKSGHRQDRSASSKCENRSDHFRLICPREGPP